MHRYFEIVSVRALNNTRGLYAPSYLGLRLLLDSLPKEGYSDWGNRLVFRKLLTRTDWRYRSFQELKEIDGNHAPVYRDFAAGSPLTLLTEATVLDLLAREPAFKTHPCAYSYLWPESNVSGRSYEFYLTGYDRRNRMVTRFLRDSPDDVAVVVDIKDFYPSVNQSSLLLKLRNRLSKVSSTGRSQELLGFAESLLNVTPTGIPVGPKLGHLLGHVALEEVDQRLCSEFGQKYLRYVDDIVVVCHGSQVEHTFSQLQSAIEDEGLFIKERKKDVVPGHVWIRDVPQLDMTKNSPSLWSLLGSMSAFLVGNPQDFDELRHLFRASGFALPFTRLRAMSQYQRYVSFLRALLKKPLQQLSRPRPGSHADLLSMASALREETLSNLRMVREEQPPPDGMRRRWYVQRCRYLLNSMLYLVDPGEHSMLTALIPDMEEFQEYRLLLDAFAKEDATDLLPLHGGWFLPSVSCGWKPGRRQRG